MIQDTSSMDRQVVVTRTPRTMILIAVAVAAVLILTVVLFPSVRRWARAEKAVDATTLRFGTVHARRSVARRFRAGARRGFAPSDALQLRAGDRLAAHESRLAGAARRRAGHDRLARSCSPPLEQARAQLLSIRAELERQKIMARQTQLRARQQVDLLALRLEAAEARADAERDHVPRRSQQQDRLRIGAGRRAHRPDGARPGPRRSSTSRARRSPSRRQTREQQVVSQQSVAADLAEACRRSDDPRPVRRHGGLGGRAGPRRRGAESGRAHDRQPLLARAGGGAAGGVRRRDRHRHAGHDLLQRTRVPGEGNGRVPRGRGQPGRGDGRLHRRSPRASNRTSASRRASCSSRRRTC